MSTSEHDNAIQMLLDGESKWDQRLIAGSSWLNPILVKETRQALKSRQFVWTFLLLITIVIVWTLIGILTSVPNIFYDSDGSAFLLGYLLILLVPAILVIPQATFRSMASELEDGTFETLSLSLLSPTQIVYGKLSIAVLQLVIYLSILAPCIALTYLLQGVTLDSIGSLLLIISTTSLFLSALSILLASLSRTRMLQVLFSVVMIGLQLVAGGILLSIVFGILSGGALGSEGWMATGLGLAALVGYGWLSLRCASSAIGMASENRSTPIRRALFIVGMAIPICGGFLLIANANRLGGEVGLIVCIIANLACVHWGIAGGWMMGESGIITNRARRTLPDTFFGRLFLTWFNPGAGPAYLFVVLSFAGPFIAWFMVLWIVGESMNVATSLGSLGGDALIYCAALAAYLALYLGGVRLILLSLFRKKRESRMRLSFAMLFVLLGLSIIVSCSLSLAAGDYRDMNFDWYCFINPFWTLGEFFPNMYGRGGPWNLSSEPNLGAWVALIFSAGVIFAINALLTARDVMITRIETPPRVLKERPRQLHELHERSWEEL